VHCPPPAAPLTLACLLAARGALPARACTGRLRLAAAISSLSSVFCLLSGVWCLVSDVSLSVCVSDVCVCVSLFVCVSLCVCV
jgi:hypothetical protein